MSTTSAEMEGQDTVPNDNNSDLQGSIPKAKETVTPRQRQHGFGAVRRPLAVRGDQALELRVARANRRLFETTTRPSQGTNTLY